MDTLQTPQKCHYTNYFLDVYACIGFGFSEIRVHLHLAGSGWLVAVWEADHKISLLPHAILASHFMILFGVGVQQILWYQCDFCEECAVPSVAMVRVPPLIADREGLTAQYAPKHGALLSGNYMSDTMGQTTHQA